jgi:hypothetical protein
VVGVGNNTIAGQIIVDPGPDLVLDTTPTGDEVVSPLRARFDHPSVAGTSKGLADSPDWTNVTEEQAFSGTRSLQVQWAFANAANPVSHLRLTTNGNPDPALQPETHLNPDPVIPLDIDGTWCDGNDDLTYSFMMKLEPVAVKGDCDFDGDIDMADYGCFQQCFGTSPLSVDCKANFDYYDDDSVGLDDYEIFRLSLTGPQS